MYIGWQATPEPQLLSSPTEDQQDTWPAAAAESQATHHSASVTPQPEDLTLSNIPAAIKDNWQLGSKSPHPATLAKLIEAQEQAPEREAVSALWGARKQAKALAAATATAAAGTLISAAAAPQGKRQIAE